MICSRIARRLLLSLFIALPIASHAAGPRWVTGRPYYTQEGLIVAWYTTSPRYFTDPGDLSPYVDHAAADAIVAAAANVWTVPTTSLNLLYGGVLAEHANSANTYLASTGLVFPSDIQSSNYLNKQIAVLYDYDGSIIDLMLGSGASSPSGCRQNAVIESVDSISTAGKIQHAILVLNGRCTGPAPEQQLQLQYQLMRAFGRVLGLGWSQTNDNVFTGSPRPTVQQALHWPVMHPIDIICGPYTYQCMPSPFTLRDDDLSGLAQLYPVGPNTGIPSIPGKTDTYARTTRVYGTITFPNGQGMQGVNVVVHRLEAAWNVPEPWESASAVSGILFRRRSSTPINQIASSPMTNMGSPATNVEGAYNIYSLPIMDGHVWENLIISTQPINPLYVGPYAVGPYDSNTVNPSGSTTTKEFLVAQSYTYSLMNFNITDAASGCQTSQDGTETSPTTIPPTGWWTSNVCTYNHAAWSLLPVKANRSLTFEVTAQDENSLPSSSKAMPVIGLWNATDAPGKLPTVASTSGAFNSSTIGMTTLTTQTSQPQQLRIAITDQRGDGRPDYTYQARVLYADSIAPATIPAKGGTITISGMGFRPGNAVTINGIAASVSSWTANTITATAPSIHTSTPLPVDIVVRDLSTGGVTTMISALTYQASVPELDLVSAPSGAVFTEVPASVPFSVKALSADGTTPLANTLITLSTTSGQVRFDVCGQTTCTLSTDASGTITSTITPLTSGAITLSAASSIGTVTASFNAIAHIQTISAATSVLYLAEHAVITWTPQVSLFDNAGPTTGLPVQWTATSGAITFDSPVSTTDANSIAQSSATAGPIPGGMQAMATACAWTTLCTNFTVNSVSDSNLRLVAVSGSQQSIRAADLFAPVVLLVTDISGNPVAGAEVIIHQTVEPWSPPCTGQGRCPIAPIYDSSTSTLISNLDGTITLQPLDLPTKPEITHIAAATGTQGFASFALERTP